MESTIVNSNRISDAKNLDSKDDTELHDAFVNEAKRLHNKKKNNPDDSVTPMAIFVPPPVILQDRKVQLGSGDSVSKQGQSTDKADSVNVKKRLALNDVASVLPFSAVQKPSSALPLAVTPQFLREGGTTTATSGAAAEFMPSTQPTQAVDTVAKASMLSASDMSVEFARSTQSVQVADVRAQNTDASTQRATAGVTPQVASAQVTTKSISGTPTELAKSHLSAAEAEGVKSEKREVSELTSALPISTPFGQSAITEGTSPSTPQEQPMTNLNGAKQQAEVLAARDKNAPVETKYSFAWGDEVTISGNSVKGYKLSGDEGVMKIIKEHSSGNSDKGYKLSGDEGDIKIVKQQSGNDSVLALGISSVESSIDKQPNQRQSTNQHYPDDADE